LKQGVFVLLVEMGESRGGLRTQ